MVLSVRDKGVERVEGRLWLFEVGQMTGIGHDGEARIGDGGGEGLSVGRRDDAVTVSPEHERGYPGSTADRLAGNHGGMDR